MAKIVRERADVIPALGEIFREHGFEGASLSIICERTGLGKGSLYHFFPGGKEEMAAAVLDEIDGWFQDHVFKQLKEEPDPQRAVDGMFQAVESYFHSGRRICLVGAFALGDTRERFALQVHSYFVRWTDALADALWRRGAAAEKARDLAEEAVAIIQGALVLARALGDPSAFQRVLSGLRARLRREQGENG